MRALRGGDDEGDDDDAGVGRRLLTNELVSASAFLKLKLVPFGQRWDEKVRCARMCNYTRGAARKEYHRSRVHIERLRFRLKESLNIASTGQRPTIAILGTPLPKVVRSYPSHIRMATKT